MVRNTRGNSKRAVDAMLSKMRPKWPCLRYSTIYKVFHEYHSSYFFYVTKVCKLTRRHSCNSKRVKTGLADTEVNFVSMLLLNGKKLTWMRTSTNLRLHVFSLTECVYMGGKKAWYVPYVNIQVSCAHSTSKLMFTGIEKMVAGSVMSVMVVLTSSWPLCTGDIQPNIQPKTYEY